MAKGDVILKFDAQTGAMVQEILKAHEALMKLSGQAAQTGKQVADSGDKIFDGMKKVAVGVGLVVTATDIAVQGIRLMISTFESAVQRAEDRAGRFNNTTKSLTQSLASSGQSGSYGDITSRISNLYQQQGMFTPKTNFSIPTISKYAANVIDRKYNTDQEEEGIAASMRAADIGMNEEDIAGTGRNAAFFARARDRGLFNGNVHDAAYSTQVYLHGGMSDQQQRFFNEAKDKDQALRLIWAAGVDGDRIRALEEVGVKSRFNPSTIDKYLNNPALGGRSLEPHLRNLSDAYRNTPMLNIVDAQANYYAGMSPAQAADRENENAEQYRQQTAHEAGLVNSQALGKRSWTGALFERQYPALSAIPKVTGMKAAASDPFLQNGMANNSPTGFGAKVIGAGTEYLRRPADILDLVGAVTNPLLELVRLQTATANNSRSADRAGLRTDKPGQTDGRSWWH